MRLGPSLQHSSAVLFSVLVIALLPAPASSQTTEHVGAIPGQFDVSRHGAANYVIPIDARVATGGMRPSISLRYHHRGGTGVAGQGWELSGLSRINRCKQTFAQDNQNRGVRFDSDDRFCLDGQRLIVIAGTYGAAGSEYRTEIESFRKIIAHGTQGNGPQYFEVTEPDGTKHFYGHLQNSSLTHTASNSYRFWARYRTEDTFGNQINYHYQATQATGEFLLDKIDYTENPSQALNARY